MFMNNRFCINFPKDGKYVSFKDDKTFYILRKGYGYDGAYEKLISLEPFGLNSINSVEYLEDIGFVISYWETKYNKKLVTYNLDGKILDSHEEVGATWFELLGNGIYMRRDSDDRNIILYDTKKDKMRELNIGSKLEKSFRENGIKNVDVVSVKVTGSGYDKFLTFEILLSMEYRLMGCISLDFNGVYRPNHMFEFYPFVMTNDSALELCFFNRNYNENNIASCSKDFIYSDYYFNRIAELDSIRELDEVMGREREKNSEVRENVHKLMKRREE